MRAPEADPLTPDARAQTPPYRAPTWLPNPHVQTIVPALFARLPAVTYRRERWETPDGDFIDLDWTGDARAGANASETAAERPLLVLFHGLEGSSASHYARVLMAQAHARGWRGVVPHFRSCGGELNRAPRFYHLSDSAEADWILRRLATRHRGPVFAVGVSLGGNVLLHWLAKHPDGASIVKAAVAVSTPLDVHAGGQAISHGFSLIYTLNFLKLLKRKALAKLDQYPGLFDRAAMLAARNMYEYDNVVTAPLHGFRDTDDYWTRSTVRVLLKHIQVPTLVLNARNDPFLPASALPAAHEVGPAVELEQPLHGGHVGFMRGPFPGQLDWLPQRIFGYCSRFIEHG
jgi:uncharacterized protein